MTANHEYLDQTTLGVIPNPLKLFRALVRPNQPFVMVNMLSFKQQATGDYAHFTGQEAYEQYGQSVQKGVAQLGSRLLWTGQVQQKVTNGIAPSFHAIALLEYASPKAFLQFVTKGGSNTKARAAGLYGQWLIASTTLEVNESFEPLNESFIVLVEMSGGMKRDPEARRRWDEVRKSIYQLVGANTLWHGRCDHHVIGTATPGIENVLATWFPNSGALEQAMRDMKSHRHSQRIQPYLAYTANTMAGF